MMLFRDLDPGCRGFREDAIVVRRNQSLSGVEMFAELAEREIDALDQMCGWRSYAAQEFVVGHQEPKTDVFFIVSGQVRVVVYSAAGKEVAFRDLGAGKSFGELSAIDGEPRSASVIALRPSLLGSMSAEAFHRILREHPEVAAQVMRYLTGLVRRLSDRVVEFSVLAVSNRIHAELLRLAREHAGNADEAVIAPAPTHAAIASRISTHREAVTRELKTLAQEGLVARRDGALVVTDVPRLAHLVAKVPEE